jgi:recombination protein RecT
VAIQASSTGDKALAHRRMSLRSLFDQQRPELTKLLPRGMEPDRLFRMALTECVKNPSLLECTAESWALAVQTCAQQGLYPDSGLGYMYLVPRKNRQRNTLEVSAMRGYQGDIQLALNSGEILNIYAEVVHQKDKYKVVKGLNRDILHEPTEDEDPGALVACYAVAKLRSGEVDFVTLRKRDVERHRASSESWEKDWSPWQKHEEAMWRKTAIHELFKWVPKASEAMDRLARDIGGHQPIDITPVEGASVPVEAPTGLEGLTARLEESKPEAESDAASSPKDCSHPQVPPSKVAALKPGKTIVCPDCGEELKPEPEDDEPVSVPPPGTPAAEGKKRPPAGQGRLME